MTLGKVVVRIITNRDATELVDHLRSAGYGVTIFDGQGGTGHVKLIYMTIERRDLEYIKNYQRIQSKSVFLDRRCTSSKRRNFSIEKTSSMEL